MSSPSKRIGPGEFRSPPEAEMVFPFENLTKDTRRMIYNILLESMYRPLLDRRHGLYYKASRIPFALILANKFLHEEVTACSKEHVAARPIVLLCRQQERKYELGVEVIAAALVRMVHIGQLYDSRYHQNTDNDSRLTHDFDFWTLKVPGKVFEAEMSRRESSFGLPPFRFYGFAFDDFYRSALMKLRRNAIQKISVRVLATDLIIVTPETLSKDTCVTYESSQDLMCSPSASVTVLCQEAPPDTLPLTLTHGSRSCMVETVTAEEVDLLAIESSETEEVLS